MKNKNKNKVIHWWKACKKWQVDVFAINKTNKGNKKKLKQCFTLKNINLVSKHWQEKQR